MIDENEPRHQLTLARKDLTARQWLALTLREAPPEPVEFLFGLLNTVVGAWIALPWFDAFKTSPMYTALMHIIPDEFIWGMIQLSIGISTLSGLYYDRKVQRFWSAVALTSLWMGYIPAYLFYNWQNPAWLYYVVYSSAAAWTARRLWVRQTAQRDFFRKRIEEKKLAARAVRIAEALPEEETS